MTKKRSILVFNVGSSSIKYTLFEDSEMITSGNYEKLKKKEDYQKSVIEIFKSLKETKIDFIVHRVVHGGEINKPSKINESIKQKIKEFSKVAPLHNPNQLMVIELCEHYNKPQYAVFDTMFFSELPEVAKVYAIPKEITKKYGIRRYGFHGLSHKNVSQGVRGRTITCHLGSGSSICAILNGKPQDISMGFTPSEGLMMGTRSGTIDPGIIFFLQENKYDVKKILTEESGFKGLTGFNDFRDILSGMEKNQDCRLAFELFAYQIAKTIGSYIAVLHGLDNLIFTAKIGENVPKLRKKICDYLSFMGIEIDDKKNNENADIISSRNSKVKILVKKTNEEKTAVEEVLKVLKN